LDAAAAFIADEADAAATLAGLIGSARADPFYRPPFRSVADSPHLGLLLVEDPRLAILLGVTLADPIAEKKLGRTGSASVTFDGQLVFYRFLKSGGATLSFWECPPIDAGFSADASGRCRRIERRRIRDGETFRIDGRSESFTIDHAVGDVVYLKAETPVAAAPVSVQYDSDTLAFVGASGGDEAAARVQMMVSLLRLMDRKDAAPVIADVLCHPHFYVRWHAMRELLALDAEAALPALRDMAAADPHPDVRAAAAATLEAFFPEEEDAGKEEAEPCRA
jgi:hypothetical protein